MSVLTPSQSFLRLRSAPLDYRIRARQVEAAAEEVEKVVDACKTENCILNEDLCPGVESLASLVDDFDARWKTLLQQLEQTGLPGLLVDPILDAGGEFVERAIGFLTLLRRHTDSYTEPLARIAAILDRITPQIKALQSMSGQFPALDPARLERGLQEMERGEGVDADELLPIHLRTEEP